jgi:hypothetical protein
MKIKPFAEVIESSLDSVLAQSWEWNEFPEFGSLVEICGKDQKIFGCVTAIKTGSMDPMRYPFPYQKTEEELLREQPQIFEFLKTTFNVIVLGHVQEKINYMLPAKPPKIHSFVSRCSTEFSSQIFSKPDFLYLLFSSQSKISHFDELILSIFKHLKKENKLTTTMINNFSKTFSLLTGNDYRRIKLFLKRTGSLL